VAVLTWDGDAYPRARANRGTAPAAGAQGPLVVNVPTTRIWSFALMHNVVDGYRCVVSPRYVGPAIVKAISYELVGNQSATRSTYLMPLISSDDSGQGVAAAGVALPTGAPIMDGDYSVSAAYTPIDRDAIHADSNLAQPRPHDELLDYVTQLPEFYLKLVLRSTQAAVVIAFGRIVLYTNVDPELLPELLG